MKLLHTVELSVFVKDYEGDSEETIKNKLISLIPFDLEEAKVELKRKAATGTQENRIIIFTLILKKDKHIKSFLDQMLNRLTKEQQEFLFKQKESRLDEELDFFIRFDKKKLVEKDELSITDSGDCFHLRMAIAAFPAKREKALDIIEKIFKEKDT